VSDTKGHPIAGATAAVESGPSRPDIAAETGFDGVFVLAGLTPGRYLLRAEADGFSPGFAEVTILAGRKVSTMIQLLTDSTTEPAEDEWFERASEESGGDGDETSALDR